MKFSTVFIFLSFLTVQFTSLANKIPEKEYIRQYYPTLEEVLTHVTETISYECDECAYGIAKMPNGYFLTINAEGGSKNSEPEYIMVWDRWANEFVDFDITEHYSKRRLREIPEEFKWVYNQVMYYDFFLYYGYENWAEDTRKLLESSAGKTPEDLENLARAHASLAQAYLRPEMHQDYMALDRKMGLKDEGYGKTSPLQKQRFQEHSEKALDYWKQLRKDAPDYTPLIIDDVQLKLGHEFMHFYLLSKSIKENGLANSFLNNAYYSEAWIQFAKNLLDACDENGVLFTAGDSDTYTVLYVQERLGIRTDVKVINTSMLSAGWYWEMLRDDLQLASRVKEKEFAVLDEKPVFVDYQALSVPFEQWLDNELKSKDTLNYRVIPSELLLPYDNGTIRLELKTGDLSTGDIVLLDILASNDKLKAFTSAPYSMVNLGFYYNLATTGRSFSIVHDREKAMESLSAIENVEDLVFYTTIPYLESLGSAGAGEISILSYLVLNISPIFKERKAQVLEKLYKQLSPKDVIATENYELIDALNAFYEVMKPEASEEMRELLQPLAEDLILNTTSLSNALEDDLRQLEFLFSIYAHFRVYEYPEYEINLSDIDRSILGQLKEKAEVLAESPVIMQRAWSRQQILRLLEALDRVAIE